MVPVAVDGLVASLGDDVDLVAGVELVVEAVLAVEVDDERSGPMTSPISAGWSKLNQFESGTSHFKPDLQSMISRHSSGLVDGLVVLELSLKDDDKSAQLNDVVVLGPTDGWAERADNNDNALLSQHAQIWLLR